MLYRDPDLTGNFIWIVLLLMKQRISFSLELKEMFTQVGLDEGDVGSLDLYDVHRLNR